MTHSSHRGHVLGRPGRRVPSPPPGRLSRGGCGPSARPRPGGGGGGGGGSFSMSYMLEPIGHRSRCRVTPGRIRDPRRRLRPTVAAVSRHCSRTGCAERAAVTLTYQYGQAQVWLDDLSRERDPHAYDLCARHAGRLTVPQGWLLATAAARRRSPAHRR